MKIEKAILDNGEILETERPLTNREIEEKLYELTEIVKSCVSCSANNMGVNLIRSLIERLDKLQEDLQ